MPAPPSYATIGGFKAQFTRDFRFTESTPDGVMDSDITLALNTAAGSFNACLFDSTQGPIAFNLAAAHFLYRNIRNAGGVNPKAGVLLAKSPSRGLRSGAGGRILSKAVEGVSVQYEGRELPRQLKSFEETPYGVAYLEMVLPRLVGGGIDVVQGESSPDAQDQIGTPIDPAINS